MAKKPFGVRQAGLENRDFPTFEKEGQVWKNTGETHKGCVEPIKGFDSREAADADVAERNARSEAAGLKARYEVVEN